MRILGVVVAALLVAPAGASAATLSFDGGRLTFVAAPGEKNSVYLNHGVDGAGPYVQLVDRNGIDADGPLPKCEFGQDGPKTIVTCDRVPVSVHLGDGDDFASGSPGDDSLHGGGGDDELFGNAGDDVLDGGDGDDAFEAPRGGARDRTPGADAITGGAGADVVGYLEAEEDLTISLDGQANDGVSGEGDNVAADVETVIASDGDDTLIGSAGADNLEGGYGNDTITGGPGDDALSGDMGDDRVSGEDGNDRLEGSGGSDVLDGGAGTDALKGDETCTVFNCNGGDDLLLARDGARDTLNCGVRADRAVVDADDVIATDLDSVCEAIDRPPPIVNPDPGTQPVGVGGAGREQRPAPALDARFTRGPRTRVQRLVLRNVSAGARVTLKCSMRRCVRSPRAWTVSRDTAALDLRRRLIPKRLPAGATLTVSVTPGPAWRIRMRAANVPSIRVTREALMSSP
jgi:Ca2+-binding RTX toxin-like protein